MSTQGKRRLSTGEAKARAQELAFAPFAFFAATTLRDSGVLDALARAGRDGASSAGLAEATGLTPQGTAALLDFAVDLGIVEAHGEGFVLAPLGHVLLSDATTRVNMDFTRDVARHGLPVLHASVRAGTPVGLRALGPWPTLYDGLGELDESVATSWYRFDQFYSDQAFRDLLPHLFARPVRHLVDIGANTGRLAHACLEHDDDVHVTLVDLPGPLEQARQQLTEAGLTARATLHAADLREDDPDLPGAADAYVMSQLLACFSPEDIVRLLKRTAAAMAPTSRLYIVELCPDRQREPAARYSLNAISLYFICLANGNSRFYRRDDLAGLIARAGLHIEAEIDNLGAGHTLFCCRPSPGEHASVGEAT